MTPLRQRMLEDMQLRGLAARTQEAYLAAVKQLALHYGKSPDLITDEEVRPTRWCAPGRSATSSARTCHRSCPWC